MSDLTADPSGIQSYGGDITSIGETISSDFEGSRTGLDASTDGLNAPAELARMVEAWASVCQGVSSEVCRAGDGTIASGVSHDTNESDQESGMRSRNIG